MTDQSEQTLLLAEIAKNTREMALWLRVAYADDLKRRIEIVLDTPAKRLVYSGSEAGASSRALAALGSVGDKTVRDWWREWFEAGLVEETETQGRFQRLFDLHRLGVSVPQPTSKQRSKD